MTRRPDQPDAPHGRGAEDPSGGDREPDRLAPMDDGPDEEGLEFDELLLDDEPGGSAGGAAGLLEVSVPDEHAGQRLDQVLAALVPARSRSQLQRLIKEGHVRLAGVAVTRPGAAVKAGATLAVDVPPPAASSPVAEALPLPIVYQDHDIVVVDKPAGMVVHPAAGHREGTLVNALLHHVTDLSGIGGELRPGIVHRLDRGTSGLMVVAKHDRAHQALGRQFRDREVTKEYLALVWGVVNAGRRIEEAIGRDPRNRQKMSTRARRSRTAVTRITGAEHLPGVTAATLAIATGRTHQIRVHLSAIGHPVVGDALYGGVRRRVPPHLKAVARLQRPFLHAMRLAFRHPTEDRMLEFSAPLPEDLQGVLDEVRAARERFGA
jgi:23S rRNA pseudouridine1911/1915/1917 synthase